MLVVFSCMVALEEIMMYRCAGGGRIVEGCD
jgi:hypothetical protein